MQFLAGQEIGAVFRQAAELDGSASRDRQCPRSLRALKRHAGQELHATDKQPGENTEFEYNDKPQKK